jgi:hypothetical protein
MMAKDMTEERKVGLVRNALLVAGQEMGESGDHWPVINDAIHNIAKDWEEQRIQKNVDEELQIHLYEQLEIMEKGMADCSPAIRAELTPKLKELREIYDSYFSSLDESAVAPVSDDEIPVYLKRAEAIIATLGGHNE